jgi:hypothetical protein
MWPVQRWAPEKWGGFPDLFVRMWRFMKLHSLTDARVRAKASFHNQLYSCHGFPQTYKSERPSVRPRHRRWSSLTLPGSR